MLLAQSSALAHVVAPDFQTEVIAMTYRIEKTARTGFALACALMLLACGDAKTTDTRGYTKAPLEQAGVLIKPEGSSAMDSLGAPTMPKDTLIPAEPAAPATSTTQ